MLLAAANDLNLDLSHSLVIGDRLSDLQAGIRAGLAWLAHVLTGYGVKERKIVEKWFIQSRNSIGDKSHFELLLLNSLCDFPFSRFACF